MNYPPPDGTPYRPSNGTEGDIFESNLCENCHRWRNGQCRIHMAAYLHQEEEEGYPSEWVWQDQQPHCTAFILKGSVKRPYKPRAITGQLDLLS